MALHSDDPNWVGHKDPNDVTDQEFAQILSDMIEDGVIDWVGLNENGHPLMSLSNKTKTELGIDG